MKLISIVWLFLLAGCTGRPKNLHLIRINIKQADITGPSVFGREVQDFIVQILSVYPRFVDDDGNSHGEVLYIGHPLDVIETDSIFIISDEKQIPAVLNTSRENFPKMGSKVVAP